jgi:uncharacterized Tic20 family protein
MSERLLKRIWHYIYIVVKEVALCVLGGFRIDTPAPKTDLTPMENTPPPVPSHQPPPVPSSPTTDNSLAVVMHLLGFAGFVFPFGNIIAPLILWLVKRTESPLLDRVGKEVVNFQISYTIYAAIAGILCFVLIGFLILPVIFILWVVFMVIAAVKTGNGEDYQYPLTIRLLQ